MDGTAVHDLLMSCLKNLAEIFQWPYPFREELRVNHSAPD